MQPLNYSDFVVVKVSFGFAVNPALSSSFCSKVINRLSKRPNVSSVCIPTIANLSFTVVIKRQVLVSQGVISRNYDDSQYDGFDS
jgi:hypothetical protein